MLEGHFVLSWSMCQNRVPSAQNVWSGIYLWSRPFPWCFERLSTCIRNTAGFLALNSLLLCTSRSILVLLLYLCLLFWHFSWVTAHGGFNYLNGFWGFFFSQKKSHHCPSVNYINLSWEARDYVPKSFLWKTSAVSYFVDLFLPWAISRSKVMVFIERWWVRGLRNPSLYFRK